MNGYRKIIGAIFALVIWWYAVVNLWQSDDTRLVAIVVAMVGVATIGGVVVGLYEKVANRRWW